MAGIGKVDCGKVSLPCVWDADCWSGCAGAATTSCFDYGSGVRRCVPSDRAPYHRRCNPLTDSVVFAYDRNTAQLVQRCEPRVDQWQGPADSPFFFPRLDSVGQECPWGYAVLTVYGYNSANAPTMEYRTCFPQGPLLDQLLALSPLHTNFSVCTDDERNHFPLLEQIGADTNNALPPIVPPVPKLGNAH